MRYYNPQTGRWLSPDPLGMVDGPNLYAYVNNNPANWIDPWGLEGNGGNFPGGNYTPDDGTNSSGGNGNQKCPGQMPINPDQPWWEDWLDEFFTAPWNIGSKAFGIEREEYGNYRDPFEGDYRHFIGGAIISRQFGPILGAAALWLHQRDETDPRDAAAEWRGWRAAWRHLFTSARKLGKDYTVRPIGETY